MKKKTCVIAIFLENNLTTGTNELVTWLIKASCYVLDEFGSIMYVLPIEIESLITPCTG